MDDFLEAMEIFKLYVEKDTYAYNYPFRCEHDVMYLNLSYEILSEHHRARLEELGFEYSEYEGIHSYRFGSC